MVASKSGKAALLVCLAAVAVAGRAWAEELPYYWTAAQRAQYGELKKLATWVHEKERLTQADLRRIMVAVADKDEMVILEAFCEKREVPNIGSRGGKTRIECGPNLVSKRVDWESKNGDEIRRTDVDLLRLLMGGFELERRARFVKEMLEVAENPTSECIGGKWRLGRVENGITLWEVTDAAGKGAEIRAYIDKSYREDFRPTERKKTLDSALANASKLVAEHQGKPCNLF